MKSLRFGRAALISAFAVSAAIGPAFAQQAQNLGTFSSWTAWKGTDANGEMCYISSQPQGFACEGNKTAGISTMSFTASGTSLSGELVESASPCQPISRSFTAVREGDLTAGVAVADPNSV